MKLLDYSWINTNADTPLDCTRLSLMLQEAIVEIEAAPRGTKVKSEYGIDSKRTAIKQFKNDLKTAHKNLHYWLFTREGLERIQEEPNFLNQFFSRHYNCF